MRKLSTKETSILVLHVGGLRKFLFCNVANIYVKKSPILKQSRFIEMPT